jgi:hypothetical protein
MYIKFVVPFLLLSLLALTTSAQDKVKMKFGKISVEDFKQDRFAQDTGAHAIVLAEIGSSEFEADGGDFQLIFKVHRRIKILDKNGYEAASVEIPLYKGGTTEEKVSNLKAASYNLENGKVVETHLESKGVFTDKQDKNLIVKKFTLPAVKEGTIIEYTYTVTSDFYFNLRSWAFQGEYPVLWSEYSVSIPEYFNYIFLGQGYHSFQDKTRKDAQKLFSFRVDQSGPYGSSTGRTETFSLIVNVTTHRWVAVDVPPLKDESFTTTLRNHITKIEFQLSAIKYPNSVVKPILSTWPKLTEEMLKDEQYGEALDKNNGFLGDVVDGLIAGAKTPREKAEKIYAYVRDNFTCNEHSALWMQKTLKSIFAAKSGNVTEINLVLVAMLRRAKLDASPVILSTREHGYVYSLYPIRNRFNYTIVAFNSGEEMMYLDASYPFLGFGKLDHSCYNGDARMVTPEAAVLRFDSDSLLEQKFTSVILAKGENGTISGSFQQRPTYFESYNIRSKVKDKGKEEYFKPLAKSYFNTEVAISNKEIEDLSKLESPVMVKYEFVLDPENQDVLYLNPLFGEVTKTNPFKALDRKYPVELPSIFDEVYSFNMEIPEGYEVDELPKSSVARFNEDEGLFQYMIQQNDNMIQFRCRTKLNKANFVPEEYPNLREFFDLIVKKQAEQIVLKKKK